MSLPTVSICLPNLNQRPFIAERMETIIVQTYKDWECVAFDNFSDDGSWDIINEYAKKDPRIIARQAPRAGMYENWNNCIQEAKGEFIYIATSDDTMTPDCLEKMVTTLVEHPECDICQCALQMIDRTGKPLNGENGGFCWEKLAAPTFFGDRLKISHIRRAPYDGLVALAYGTVWTSMTQVLIRKDVFDKAGLFQTDWGAVGDAAWQMRAGLIANVVYIPDKLATWRYYDGQGSGAVHQQALEEGWMHRMGRDAVAWIGRIQPSLGGSIRRSGILHHFSVDMTYRRVKSSLHDRHFARAILALVRSPISTWYLFLSVIRNRFCRLNSNKHDIVREQISCIVGNPTPTRHLGGGETPL